MRNFNLMPRNKRRKEPKNSLSNDLMMAFRDAQDGETIYVPSSVDDVSATKAHARVIAGRYRKLNGLSIDDFSVTTSDGPRLHGKFTMIIEHYDGFPSEEFNKTISSCVKEFFARHKNTINLSDISKSSVEVIPPSVKLNVKRSISSKSSPNSEQTINP